MKKYIIVLFVLVVFSARAETFNLMPLKIHYLGAVGAGDNIISYGTNGAYLLSTDKGQSWEQRSLNNFGQINHIINFKDTLWGVVNNGYIISSTDNGLHWNEYNFSIDTADRLINIIVNDNHLFIRSLKNIYLLDKNKQIVKTYTNDLIEIMKYNNCIINDSSIYYENYYDYFFGFLNDNLVINTKPGNNNFIVLDKSLSVIKTINLEENIKVGSPWYYDIYNIFEVSGENIFNIGAQLYRVNDDFSSFEYFFKDKTFMNFNDSNYYKRRYVNPNSYFSFNNELYALRNEDDTITYNDKLIIKKHYCTKQDTFISFNNYFIDNYATKYFQAGGFTNSGLVNNLINNGVQLIEDSLVFLNGLKKEIIFTSDLGKSWNLVSYLTGAPVAIINDSSYIFHNDKKYSRSNFNEICRSNDYGSTFLPMYQCEDCSYTIRGLTYPSVFYINEAGEGFLAASKDQSTDTNNLALLTDGCSKYKMITLPRSSYNATKIYKGSNVIDLDGHYMFSTSSIQTRPGYILYFTDKNFENFRYITYDSLFYVHHILAEEFENFLMFCSVKEDRDHNFSSFEVYETNDSGKTKSSICKIDDSLAVNQIYELNKDSVFFAATYPARILMYDRKRNTFDNLYENAELDSIFFMELSGNFYILGEELFLENTDRNDLTKWEEADWDYGRPSFTSVIFKGNVALVGLSDSLRPFNYYRMMTEEHAPVGVEIQAEKLYYTNHFYAGNPYPLPGRNLIKTFVTYDKSFDLEESILGVYDLSGEQVQNKEHIEINWLNKASAEFIWNCSAVPSGIYFILVRHNGITDSIPIVVEK